MADGTGDLPAIRVAGGAAGIEARYDDIERLGRLYAATGGGLVEAAWADKLEAADGDLLASAVLAPASFAAAEAAVLDATYGPHGLVVRAGHGQQWGWAARRRGPPPAAGAAARLARGRRLPPRHRSGRTRRSWPTSTTAASARRPARTTRWRPTPRSPARPTAVPTPRSGRRSRACTRPASSATRARARPPTPFPFRPSKAPRYVRSNLTIAFPPGTNS